MVLETEHRPAENTHSLAKTKIPESVQRFQDKLIGPVLQVRILRDLDISGIEKQILSTTTKDRTSWVARGLGSPRRAQNRRRRTREGPEPACVQTLSRSGGTRREGRATTEHMETGAKC